MTGSMHTMKTYSRKGIIAPNILHLYPRWRCAGDQHHFPETLQRGRHPRYPVNKMLDWPHSRYKTNVAEVYFLKIE